MTGENLKMNYETFPGPNLERDLETIESDYSCVVCDRQIVNAPPQIVFAFALSLLVTAVCCAGMFLREDASINYYLPVLTTMLGIWVPSPVQLRDRKESDVTNARLNAMSRGLSSMHRPPSNARENE